MPRHFELWDTDTRNLMATFTTEAEALTVVRNAICADGPAAVSTWALGWEDSRGRGKQIAAGADLADRALKAAPA